MQFFSSRHFQVGAILPDTTSSAGAAAAPDVIRKTSPVHNSKRPDMSDRDHLVMMLTSGAEIEHALMVQYLFAAYSLNGDQESEELRKMVEGWRASILSVAREEMGHLLTVQNVLVLLGAPINLGREMMPWDHQFYPFSFSLEALSLETLQCFIYAEMPTFESVGKEPAGSQKFVPSAVGGQLTINEQKAIITDITDELAGRFKNVKEDMHQVGELYAQIIHLIADPKRIPDSVFNEATYDMQASWDDWGRGYKSGPRTITPDGNLAEPYGDPVASEPPSPYASALAGRAAHVMIDRAATRAQAVKALRALAEQGEAPHLKKASDLKKDEETWKPSHFERFAEIYRDYKEVLRTHPSFKPTHDVTRNPTTRIDFHDLYPDDTTYIGVDDDNETAAHYIAQLFNQRYRLLLTYLAHTFRLARTQPMARPGLRGMVMHRVFGEMYNLKAIAGLLVRLPVAGGGRAGPPFEMPYTLDLPQADIDIWRLYDDLLVNSYRTCSRVFQDAKLIPQMRTQIPDIGADVYLRTLMDLDSQTRQWIAKVIAGAA
jgi:hypothetical protein